MVSTIRSEEGILLVLGQPRVTRGDLVSFMLQNSSFPVYSCPLLISDGQTHIPSQVIIFCIVFPGPNRQSGHGINLPLPHPPHDWEQNSPSGDWNHPPHDGGSMLNPAYIQNPVDSYEQDNNDSNNSLGMLQMQDREPCIKGLA